MKDIDLETSQKARELRRSFERSFGLPRLSAKAASEDLVLIRISGRRYALRMAELRGLHPGCRITPLPSADPALLGIVGIRGQLVPTYSLPALLGGGEQSNETHWLVICGCPGAALALAFDEFTGSVRVSESDLFMPPASETLPPYIAQLARIGHDVCYVISTGSILQAMTASQEQSPAGDQRPSTHANATRR